MSEDAMTREQIETWKSWFAGRFADSPTIVGQANALCDMALRSAEPQPVANRTICTAEASGHPPFAAHTRPASGLVDALRQILGVTDPRSSAYQIAARALGGKHE